MIDVEVDEAVAVLTVDRPERRNAMSARAWIELGAALDDVVAQGVQGVILTGAGDRVFVAGADIGELVGREPLENLDGLGQRVTARIEQLPVPTVAAINGHALGGGCEIALACDYRVAVRTAKLGQPEVAIGIVPGAGGTVRLPRLVGYAKALELILTGEPVDAEEACRIGLVNAVCEPGGVLPAARRFLELVASRGATAVGLVRQVLKAGAAGGEHAGLLLERLASAAAYADPERRRRMTEFLNR
jgi:enoyl-CoA hydratase